jgi:hypothetical protein
MMRIVKSRDEGSGCWYYADSNDRRVSPTYEHEGMLDKWAEVKGAFTTFVVYRRIESGEEKNLGSYIDYETADRLRIMENKSNPARACFVREEVWIAINEVVPNSDGM